VNRYPCERMERQRLASLFDEKGDKSDVPKTTKGGVQKMKFMPSVPSTRRQKTEAAEPSQSMKSSTSTTKQDQGHQRPRGSSSLIGAIAGENVTGTFAHGFGVFSKNKSASFLPGSVSADKATKPVGKHSQVLEPIVKSSESVGIDSVIDSGDPFSPMTVSKHINANHSAINNDTLCLIQLSGLLEMLDFGVQTFASRSKKPTRLLEAMESEKVIDMAEFNASERDDREPSVSWPSDKIERIGNVNFHKSGKITVSIGEFEYELVTVDASDDTSVWAIDKEYGQIIDIGTVSNVVIGWLCSSIQKQ
jgi:hypothetical protein